MGKRQGQILVFGLVVLAGSGCGRIDLGPGSVPLGEFSANISAGDLLDRRTAGDRLSRYLEELETGGYRKQIRIILPPDWGPRIYEHWFPVIRAHGFKVLAILGQERRDSTADVPATIAWIRHILPLVRSDLMGIEIINEPAHWFTPEDYAAYHQKIAPLIRSLAPEVPIVAGDFSAQEPGKNTLKAWQAMVAAGATDYDILSLHLTGITKKSHLDDLAHQLPLFLAPDKKIWITEGDWGQLPYLRQQGLKVEETFLYTWNDDELPALIRRPGGRLP